MHDAIKERSSWKFRGVEAAANLGVDFALKGRTTKVTRKRYTKVRTRKPRYNFLRKMRGKSERIAIMGARPAITYACSVVGISDTQLKANRAMLASMAFGDMPGSSINLKYILAENRELDPLFVYVVAPIFKWACMV